MLALPPEDPRNWYRHALVHTIDCPHGNWWFLPWHRGYLGWFEQICRELSNDPAFALPY
jgi:tyrosinase